MKIKKHYIFLLLAVILFMTTLIFPQLTGRVFVNNLIEKKPTDWLSAIVLKNYREPREKTLDIPNDIKTIRITGNNVNLFNFPLDIVETDASKAVKYRDGHKVSTRVNKDTLIINLQEGYVNDFKISIDSTIQQLVFDALHNTEVRLLQKNPLHITVNNNSDIILSQNSNTKKILINNNSTLEIINFFTPILNIEIDNSMVYLDPLNNIDSLNANLKGKSNIKTQEVIKWRDGAKNDFESFKKQLNINKTAINIYPTGNLQYYSKKK